MTRPLRVGVVGCGGNSANHLQAYSASRKAELVALFDVDLERARAQAQCFGVSKVCQNLANLASLNIDLIDIVTPTPTHANLAIQALETGSHVIVEKPMAASTAECEQMIRAACESGRTLGVVHNKRFFDSIQKTKQVLDRERLSVARMRYTHFQVGEQPRPWMLEDMRGIWWETLVHPVYITQYLMGPIKAVCARGRSIHYPVIDSMSVLCQTAGGVSYCEFDRTTREHIQSFQVLTEDGSRFDGEVMPDYVWRRARPYRSPLTSAWRAFRDDLAQPWIRWRPILANMIRQGPKRRALPFEKTFQTVIDGTLDFLQGNAATLPVPAEEGLEAIRVMEAIAKALESDAWVSVNAYENVGPSS